MDADRPRRRKRQGRRFAEAAAEFERLLLENVLPRILASGDALVAVGVDMASQEGNWGVSVISLRENMSGGTMRLLLPNRSEVEGFDKRHPVKPSSGFLFGFLSALREKRITTVVAVDVPFGWPRKHLTFLDKWSALNANQPEAEVLPTLDEFKFRLCDIHLAAYLKEQGRSPALFAVGADRIASAAFQWAKLRCDLFHRLGRISFGFPNDYDSSGIVFFETYPSAFVRLNYPECTDYKTGRADQDIDRNERRQAKKISQQKARQTLLNRIVKEYSLTGPAKTSEKGEK